MKEETDAISTRPTLNDLYAYIVGIPMFTAIASILPLLLLQWHYVHTPAGTAPSWPIVGVLIFGAAVAFGLSAAWLAVISGD